MPFLLFRIQFKDALFLETLSKDHFRSDVCQGITGRFGQERNRSGRTRIDLNDVYILILIDDELNVVKADDADAKSELFGILQNDSLYLIRYAEGRIYRDGVTGMNTGTLNQFHDSRDKYIYAVTDRIDFQFLALNVVIHQYRLAYIHIKCGFQVGTEMIFSGDNLHCPSA